ncbi:Ff.00g084500.m01.CDS01 [Fusarium sp. VM40]|nr:Ff.00g084500.m01.CDS01 [Fusarium sp. VM40]
MVDCDDNAWGPTVSPNCRGGFDFTLIFEDTVLAIIPGAVIILIAVAWLYRSRQHRRQVRSHSGFWSKAILITISSLLQLAFLVLWAVKLPRPSHTALPAAIIELTATVILGLVSYTDHFKTLQPSTLLCLYLPLDILLGIPHVRTLWLMQLQFPLAPVLTACLPAKMIWLVLEARQKQILLEEHEDVTEEEVAGVLSQCVFGWLLPFIIRGSRKDILSRDLLHLDTELRSLRVHDMFKVNWRPIAESENHNILAWCLLKTFRWQLLRAVLPRLALLAFTVLQPIIIERLVDYVGTSDDIHERATGLGLIAAVALVYGGTALCTALYYHSIYRFVAMIRGALVSATYEAALECRSSAVDGSSTLTLISADVDTIVFGLIEIHELWASCIQIGLVMWLLSRQVHWGAAAPLILSLGCVGASLLLFSRLGQNQKRWNESIQVRLGATSEVLAQMREIKFMGLTNFFTEYIQNLRAKELQASQKMRRLLVGIVVISRITMTMAPVITFIIYAAPSKGNLLPARAFSSLTMIGLLSEPINVLVQAVPGFAGSLGCLSRIQGFLTSNRSKTANAESLSHEKVVQKDLEFALYVNDASFGWKLDTPVLRDLSIKIPHGWSVAITGPVACGKTTLLKGILGESSSSSGAVDINIRSVGYCDQSPWMLNTSIRDNITGLSVPDMTRYKRVLQVCDLEEDIASLPEGEQTLVGSNGIKLSHGQKQRISLARTLMQKASLILVDDLLSGLDKKNKAKVFRNAFGPNGFLKQEGTTFLLVLTEAHFLHFFDHVIVLSDTGTISQQGLVKQPERDAAVQMEQQTSKSDCQVSPTATGANEDEREQVQEEPEGPLPVAALPASWKAGDWSLYGYYVAATGKVNTSVYLIQVAALAVLYNFSSIWLGWWSSKNAAGHDTSLAKYLSVYACFGILTLLLSGLASWQLFVRMVSQSALYFHSVILQSTMRAPLSFFSNTDVGTLMNHFSEDMQLFDMTLPLAALNTTAFAAISGVQLVVICVSAHWIAATIPACLLAIYLIQRLYLRTSRQVRLLDIELRAPLYRHFLESLRGLVTIRCFRWQESLTNKHYALLDDSQQAVYMLFCIQRWLTVVLDLLVAGMAILLAVFAVTLRHSMSAGAVGLAISNITTFNSNLANVVQAWTKLETSLGALVRSRTFKDKTPVEEGTDRLPALPTGWPLKGEIRIESLVASYSPSSPDTLKSISLVIQAGQKVGICGRTGSGKSSLIFSLYRGMHIKSGRVVIDGIDLATVPPEEIRSRINTITQNPLLIPGSVRFNLDFRGHQNDVQILSACRRVGLDEYLLAHGGLDAELSSLALSPGQTQLFCLARALLQPKKILILDEVTSNVDHKTDLQMRKVIEQEFQGCTIITIAHRLDFIANYDRIVVLEQGQLVEWDSPQALLSRPSHFASLSSVRV